MSDNEKSDEARMVLCCPVLSIWEVELVGGGEMTVCADGFGEKDGFLVFSFLIVGNPHYELDVLKIPCELVKDVFGGPVT